MGISAGESPSLPHIVILRSGFLKAEILDGQGRTQASFWLDDGSRERVVDRFGFR